jgi:hypothetical protein
MIDMNFADEAAATTLIVGWILNLRGIAITPFKQVFVRDLDLPTITDEIETKFGVVKIPLETNPAMNATLGLDDMAAWAARRTGLLGGGKRAHAMRAVAARSQLYVDMLNGSRDGAVWK